MGCPGAVRPKRLHAHKWSCPRRPCLASGHARLPAPHALRPEEYGLKESDVKELLDSFWLARGIYRDKDRQQLVNIALVHSDLETTAAHIPTAGVPGSSAAQSSIKPPSVTSENFQQHIQDSSVQSTGLASHTQPGAQHSARDLPGVQCLWDLHSGDLETKVRSYRVVHSVSQRLADLAALLGSKASDSGSKGEIDIAQMLLREPRLLNADYEELTQSLFRLRIKLSGKMDVAKLLEQHPSLLLVDLQQLGEQRVEDLLPALVHGLASDSDADWRGKLEELRDYVASAGDAHCGFREGDDAELARWSKKQRMSARTGGLSEEQRVALQALGFEFDADEAEWCRWYNALHAFAVEHGTTMSAPFTAEAEFYLTNWCSVQRIARRSGVMQESRVERLDSLGFDWTGADPLS